MANYAQIGIAPCGCIHAMCAEFNDSLLAMGAKKKDHDKSMKEFVNDCLKQGMAIGRVDLDIDSPTLSECDKCRWKVKESESAPLFEQ